MSLSLDAFAKANRRSGSVCVVYKIRQALDAKDRAAVDAALEDPAISGKAIARVLADAGHPVSGNSVSHHRRGDCRCDQREPI